MGAKRKGQQDIAIVFLKTYTDAREAMCQRIHKGETLESKFPKVTECHVGQEESPANSGNSQYTIRMPKTINYAHPIRPTTPCPTMPATCPGEGHPSKVPRTCDNPA